MTNLKENKEIVPSNGMNGEIKLRQEFQSKDLEPAKNIITREGIKRASQVTGIPVRDFIDVFNIEFPLNTPEGAKMAYFSTPLDSEAEKAALKNWISLCETFDEASEAFHFDPNDSEIKKATLEKWISVCATTEEAKVTYISAPNKSEIQKAALVKWNQFSWEEVQKATTVKDAQSAYFNSPPGRARKASLLKWNQFSREDIQKATTAEEAQKAYNHTLYESEIQKDALLKWQQISLKEIQKATTAEEVQRAYNSAPYHGDVKKAALKKIYTLLNNQ